MVEVDIVVSLLLQENASAPVTIEFSGETREVTASKASITETFTGTLAAGGLNSHNFIVATTSQVAITLSAAGPPAPYRTLVCYKESQRGQRMDPADPPMWTGTWRDPRLSPPADGGIPENALTGTRFFVERNPATASGRIIAG